MFDINDMLNFINESPTAFHTTYNISLELKKNGFVEIFENDKWNFKSGDKVFVKKHDSSIVAFEIGNDIEKNGFSFICAHNDSPAFKIKASPQIIDEKNYIKLNTEPYGGMITSTWVDRPLSVAGKIFLKGESNTKFNEIIIDVKEPLLVIPNLAIHLNREVNKGFEYNTQNNLLPIIGLVNEKLEKNDYLFSYLEKRYFFKKEDILDFELFIYYASCGVLTGIDKEFVLSPRLDDISMVYCALEAFINSKSEENNKTKVLVCLDNEEVGSQSAEGADSNLLNNYLERVMLAVGNKNNENLYRALSKSIMISADLAHALHPNFKEKADLTSRPILGKGPAIKYNSNKRYSTNGYISSIVKCLFEDSNIEYQNYFNRSDVPAGSTLGPILSSKLNIPTIDLGVPILGMHSIIETGAKSDFYDIYKVFEKFYEIKG